MVNEQSHVTIVKDTSNLLKKSNFPKIPPKVMMLTPIAHVAYPNKSIDYDIDVN